MGDGCHLFLSHYTIQPLLAEWHIDVLVLIRQQAIVQTNDG